MSRAAFRKKMHAVPTFNPRLIFTGKDQLRSAKSCLLNRVGRDAACEWRTKSSHPKHQTSTSLAGSKKMLTVW